MPLNDFSNFRTSHSSKTGLAYLVSSDIPGDETLASNSVAAGHRVFKASFAMSKPVYPAYNGHLNSSAQVSTTDFRLLINQNHAEAFKNFCGTGKVFDKMVFLVLSSYGAPSSLGLPKLSIELDQVRIASATANIEFTQHDFTGPGVTTNDLMQGDVNLDSRMYGEEAFKHFKTSRMYLLEIGLVCDKSTFIYFPVGTDGTQEGQLATTFQISTNSLPS